MLLIRSHLQPSRVRFNDLGIFKAFLKIIDQHIVEHTRLAVLMLHVQVISFYLIVEHPLRYIQFRRFLFHGDK